MSRNDVSGILFFDIETEINPHMIKYIEEPAPPGNYRDIEKIRRYLDEKRAEFLDKAPLDLDFAQIRAIGLASGWNDPEAVVAGEELDGKPTPVTEEDLLRWFWRRAQTSGILAGYNIVGFDLPIIQRRSFALGIAPTRQLFDIKPWDTTILDVMRTLYHNGYGPGIRYRGLKWFVRAYGIKTAWDVEEADGSQVRDMSIEEVKAYVISDVARTRAIAEKMKGLYW